MKKLMALLLAITLLCSLTACRKREEPTPSSSDTPSSPSEEASQEPRITIAGIIEKNDLFMKAMERGYRNAAEEAGVDCVITSTAGDRAKEDLAIDRCISQKIDGIAISPVGTDSIAALFKAHDSGIKLALTNDKLHYTPHIVGGYYSGGEGSGKVLGEAVAAFVKEKGWTERVKIRFVYSEGAVSSDMLTEGFYEGLANEGVESEHIIFAQEDTPDDAKGEMEEILRWLPEVQIVICIHSEAIIAATRVIEASDNRGKTFVFGYDGYLGTSENSDEMSKLLLEDHDVLQAVVAEDSYTAGYKAVEHLIKVIRSEAKPTDQIKPVPGILLSHADPDAVRKWRADYGLD